MSIKDRLLTDAQLRIKNTSEDLRRKNGFVVALKNVYIFFSFLVKVANLSLALRSKLRLLGLTYLPTYQHEIKKFINYAAKNQFLYTHTHKGKSVNQGHETSNNNWRKKFNNN